MAKKKIYKWKLVRGVHSHGGKTYGKDQPDGDVIVTTQNLGKSMNSPGSIRVVKIDEDDEDDEEEAPASKKGTTTKDVDLDALAGGSDEDEGDESLADDAPVTEESLKKLTKAALIAFAKEKEIPLGKAKDKDAIVTAILFGLE